MSLSSITLTKQVLNQYYPKYKQHPTLPAVLIESIVDYIIEVKREYYDNGQLKYEEQYVNGKKHGLRRGWYYGGQLKFEHPYVDGKKHGMHRGWYENRQLCYEYSFVDDKDIALRRTIMV